MIVKDRKYSSIHPNDSHEAYTEHCIDRKGTRTSLKQSSLVTYIKAVGESVILFEATTKEPLSKVPEGLPGSKSVVCAERKVSNLGDPLSSCFVRKDTPTQRRPSGNSGEVRSFHNTPRRSRRPHGEGNDAITQPSQEICPGHVEPV